MGKKKEIDASEVEKLAELGLNNVDIADFFSVDKETIRTRFSLELAKGRFNLKRKLRKKQIDVALKGNVTMLIWLGKQMLGQSEYGNSFSDGESENFE
jgi:hypothetical protein